MMTSPRRRFSFAAATIAASFLVIASAAHAQFAAPVAFPDPFTSAMNGVVATTEPSIRVAPNGDVFLGAIRGVPSGIDIWQFNTAANSGDFIASPDTTPFVISPVVTLAIGGGDMDLQPTSDGKLTYSSLWLGSSTVGVDTGQSLDGQTHTFASQPLGSIILGDDRQWMAADPSGGVYMSFHDLAGNIDLLHSPGGPVAGLVYLPAGQVFQPSDVALLFNQHGNLATDKTGALYQVYAYGSTVNATGQNAVGVAKSTDGGLTWTKTDAYVDPDQSKNLATLFPSVAVNGSNVYAAFCDGDHVWVSISNDGAQHFGARQQVDQGLSATVMPWVAAGSSGADVVFYGTSTAGGNSNNAAWNVYMRQVSPTGSFLSAQLVADTDVKKGMICIEGLNCDLPNGGGGRELGDFFQVAVDNAGLADIAYTKVVDENGDGVTYAVHQTSGSIGAP